MAVKPTVEVEDDRRVWDKILRQLGLLRKTVITVGVHANDSKRTDDASNVQIAAVHEFGAGKIPERSFLRATVDGDSSIMRFAQEQADAVVHGEMTAAKAGERIGIVTSDRVKRRIRGHIAPPLAAATIERKIVKGAHGGGLASKAGDPAAPLIDTGQLINSITYEVKQ